MSCGPFAFPIWSAIEMVTPMATRILAVDDSKSIRMVIQGALNAYECAVSEAVNGQEGLAIAAREKPDVILLDVAMPVMDGIAMLGMLRRDPQLKSIPVIAMSAEPSSEDLRALDQLGISGFLTKPFREAALLNSIRKLIPLPEKTVPQKQDAESILKHA
jgi:CheY-like chemotaxis protein